MPKNNIRTFEVSGPSQQAIPSQYAKHTVKDSYTTMLKMKEICQRNDIDPTTLRRRSHSEFRQRDGLNHRDGNVVTHRGNISSKPPVHALFQSNSKLKIGIHDTSPQQVLESTLFYPGNKQTDKFTYKDDKYSNSFSRQSPIYVASALKSNNQQLRRLQRKLKDFMTDEIINENSDSSSQCNDLDRSSSANGLHRHHYQRKKPDYHHIPHSSHRRKRHRSTSRHHHNHNSCDAIIQSSTTDDISRITNFIRMLKKRLNDESFNGSKRIPAHRIPALLYHTGYRLTFEELVLAIDMLGWKKDKLVDMAMIMNLLYVIENNRRSTAIDHQVQFNSPLMLYPTQFEQELYNNAPYYYYYYDTNAANGVYPHQQLLSSARNMYGNVAAMPSSTNELQDTHAHSGIPQIRHINNGLTTLMDDRFRTDWNGAIPTNNNYCWWQYYRNNFQNWYPSTQQDYFYYPT